MTDLVLMWNSGISISVVKLLFCFQLGVVKIWKNRLSFCGRTCHFYLFDRILLLNTFIFHSIYLFWIWLLMSKLQFPSRKLNHYLTVRYYLSIYMLLILFIARYWRIYFWERQPPSLFISYNECFMNAGNRYRVMFLLFRS